MEEHEIRLKLTGLLEDACYCIPRINNRIKKLEGVKTVICMKGDMAKSEVKKATENFHSVVEEEKHRLEENISKLASDKVSQIMNAQEDLLGHMREIAARCSDIEKLLEINKETELFSTGPAIIKEVERLVVRHIPDVEVDQNVLEFIPQPEKHMSLGTGGIGFIKHKDIDASCVQVQFNDQGLKAYIGCETTLMIVVHSERVLADIASVIQVKMNDIHGKTVPYIVTDMKDGTLLIQYAPEKTGIIRLDVLVFENHISGSPFLIEVLSAEMPDSNMNFATGAQSKQCYPFANAGSSGNCFNISGPKADVKKLLRKPQQSDHQGGSGDQVDNSGIYDPLRLKIKKEKIENDEKYERNTTTEWPPETRPADEMLSSPATSVIRCALSSTSTAISSSSSPTLVSPQSENLTSAANILSSSNCETPKVSLSTSASKSVPVSTSASQNVSSPTFKSVSEGLPKDVSEKHEFKPTVPMFNVQTLLSRTIEKLDENVNTVEQAVTTTTSSEGVDHPLKKLACDVPETVIQQNDLDTTNKACKAKHDHSDRASGTPKKTVTFQFESTSVHSPTKERKQLSSDTEKQGDYSASGPKRSVFGVALQNTLQQDPPVANTSLSMRMSASSESEQSYTANTKFHHESTKPKVLECIPESPGLDEGKRRIRRDYRGVDSRTDLKITIPGPAKIVPSFIGNHIRSSPGKSK